MWGSVLVRAGVAVVRIFALMLGVLVVAACSPAPPCPTIVLDRDTGVLVARQGPGEAGLEIAARLIGYDGYCTFDEDERVTTVHLRAQMEAVLGPMARGRKARLNYYVALPDYYPLPQGKRVFTVDVSFPRGRNKISFTDEPVSIDLPLADGRAADGYEVVLGFQLDRDQLDGNRDLFSR